MDDRKALERTTLEVLRNATAMQVLRAPVFSFSFQYFQLYREKVVKKLNFGKSIATQKYMFEVLMEKLQPYHAQLHTVFLFI